MLPPNAAAPTYTPQAFREAISKLDKSTTNVRPGIADGLTLRELSAGWTSISAAHKVHSKHERDIIFPALEMFFPGQVCTNSGFDSVVALRLHACCVLLIAASTASNASVASGLIAPEYRTIGLFWHAAYPRAS